jgi:flagellar protein FlbD
VISLHRIGHQAEEFHLNPDLVVTVEANPDTVITLTTGTKVVVAEPPERVIEDVRCYRIDVLAGALKRRAQMRAAGAQIHKTAPLHVAPPAPVFAHPAAAERQNA